MSLIQIEGLADAKEPTTLPDGDEVELQIASATTGNKGSGDYLNIRFEPLDRPTAKDIFRTYMFPRDEDDPKQRNARRWAIKELLETVGLDPAQPFECEQLIGLRLWAIVSEVDDPSFGKQNKIRKLVLPR